MAASGTAAYYQAIESNKMRTEALALLAVAKEREATMMESGKLTRVETIKGTAYTTRPDEWREYTTTEASGSEPFDRIRYKEEKAEIMELMLNDL